LSNDCSSQWPPLIQTQYTIYLIARKAHAIVSVCRIICVRIIMYTRLVFSTALLYSAVDFRLRSVKYVHTNTMVSSCMYYKYNRIVYIYIVRKHHRNSTRSCIRPPFNVMPLLKQFKRSHHNMEHTSWYIKYVSIFYATIIIILAATNRINTWE